MIDEETRRLRAYQIWESEGRPEGLDLAHWYKAGDDDFGITEDGPRYLQYSPSAAPAGSLVIKFYRSGDQIRGYVRKIADEAESDTLFPGEEMEPEAAFKLAESHNGDCGRPVYIELVEGVEWDPSWGLLGRGELETIPAETDDARFADSPAAKRRRRDLARKAEKGLRRAAEETNASTENHVANVRQPDRGKK